MDVYQHKDYNDNVSVGFLAKDDKGQRTTVKVEILISTIFFLSQEIFDSWYKIRQYNLLIAVLGQLIWRSNHCHKDKFFPPKL